MESIKNILKDLTSEHVALISVMVTILLFIFGRFNELKFKKHELKKEKYFQFIDMLKEIYLKEGKIELNKAQKTKFFDFGSTIFIYGSKKMYKKYCFFRECSCDFVKKTRFYYDGIALFLVADMLNQIRKEIGMYNFEIPLNYKSIAFYANDIYLNPKINLKWWDNKLRVFLIKFELFLYKIIELVPLRIIYSIISLPFKMIVVMFKCLIQIPLGKILIKLGLDKKIEELNDKLNNKSN